MTEAADDSEMAISIAFAMQIIGADSIGDAPTPGSVVDRLIRRQTELEAQGASQAEIAAALDEIFDQRDAEEARLPEQG